MSVSVLVVDEDHSVTKSMVRLLSIHGYVVRGETSPLATLPAALAHEPAVILLDLHMRHRSGIDVARDIRAEPLLNDARLIGMSATVPDWDIEALSVFDAVLMKPILGEALLSAIEGQVAHQPSTSRARL